MRENVINYLQQYSDILKKEGHHMTEYNTADLRDRLSELKAGDEILLSGVIYTARDAAHKRIAALLQSGDALPFPLLGAVIYYAGPTPETGELPAGSFGPTTSSRMDPYMPLFLENGLLASIGKGDRAESVYRAMKENESVYFAAVGGAGALYATAVKSIDSIAFPELGCESVKRVVIDKFPLFVAIDSNGNSIFKR